VAIQARVRLGERERAAEALGELREIAARARTRPTLAALRSCEGTLAAASGDHDAARRSFEDALDLLAACQAPFETGCVRLDLATTLDALGRPDQARREIEAAVANFREIGADAERARAETMLGQLRKASATRAAGTDGPLAGLSGRELEVLDLVAQGLTNREIAARLVLSEHTVNRHVANILRKLGLTSRAAAASLAGREGLGVAGSGHSGLHPEIGVFPRS
jgi:DNA-binding CsgD family transcriptional regulator